MSDPSYVQALGAGVQPTDDPVSLPASVLTALDEQFREMERARAQAAVSSSNYLIASPVGQVLTEPQEGQQ